MQDKTDKVIEPLIIESEFALYLLNRESDVLSPEEIQMCDEIAEGKSFTLVKADEHFDMKCQLSGLFASKLTELNIEHTGG